jgi:hypothetical protein
MARKKKDAPAGEVKPMRRNTKTGELAPPVRGRPSPDWERGYVDADGTFHVGKPPKKRGRKPGRPKGSKNKVSSGAKGGALSKRLRQIIEREVALRLKGLHREIAAEVRTQVIADLAG